MGRMCAVLPCKVMQCDCGDCTVYLDICSRSNMHRTATKITLQLCVNHTHTPVILFKVVEAGPIP